MSILSTYEKSPEQLLFLLTDSLIVVVVRLQSYILIDLSFKGGSKIITNVAVQTARVL